MLTNDEYVSRYRIYNETKKDIKSLYIGGKKQFIKLFYFSLFVIQELSAYMYSVREWWSSLYRFV